MKPLDHAYFSSKAILEALLDEAFEDGALLEFCILIKCLKLKVFFEFASSTIKSGNPYPFNSHDLLINVALSL